MRNRCENRAGVGCRQQHLVVQLTYACQSMKELTAHLPFRNPVRLLTPSLLELPLVPLVLDSSSSLPVLDDDLFDMLLALEVECCNCDLAVVVVVVVVDGDD